MSLNDTMLRACCRCHVPKPQTGFHRDKNRKSGYSPECKDCFKLRRNERRARYQALGNYAVPDAITCWKCREAKPPGNFHRNYSVPSGYSGKCKDCQQRDRYIQYRRDPGAAYRAVRKCKLKQQYGLTVAAYNQMVADQGGGCAICGKEPNGKNLVVDHDHSTNIVRGLLCGSCNRGIGLLQDSPDMLRAALAYLEKER